MAGWVHIRQHYQSRTGVPLIKDVFLSERLTCCTSSAHSWPAFRNSNKLVRSSKNFNLNHTNQSLLTINSFHNRLEPLCKLNDVTIHAQTHSLGGTKTQSCSLSTRNNVKLATNGRRLESSTITTGVRPCHTETWAKHIPLITKV